MLPGMMFPETQQFEGGAGQELAQKCRIFVCEPRPFLTVKATCVCVCVCVTKPGCRSVLGRGEVCLSSGLTQFQVW